MTSDTDCLFCKIISRDIPASIVRESDRTLAFRDISPQAPTHVLVVPKVHYSDVATLAASDPAAMAEVITEGAAVAEQDGVKAFRMVFNTGAAAGQSVFHAHLHVLGGRDLTWPPG